MSDHSKAIEKAKEKIRREKKKKRYQGKKNRQKSQDSSPVTMGANAIQAIKGQKKKRRNSQGPKRDISEITCYNCNKKGNYSRNCTKPKNKL